MKLPQNIDYYTEELADGSYDKSDDIFGLDTCVRDQLFDAVSMFYVGKEWPRNIDKVNFEEFHEELLQSINSNETD